MKLFYPLQPRSNYKIDTVFCDMAYQRAFNTYHTGWDLNGKMGGSTDYGDKVYAIYDGFVTDVSVGEGKWGMIVRVWHPALNIYSRYAHLMEKPGKGVVKVGQQVKRGDVVGHLGNAYGVWIAHLHFDLMLPVAGTKFDYWNVGLGNAALADVKKHYVDPAQLFAKYGVE